MQAGGIHKRRLQLCCVLTVEVRLFAWGYEFPVSLIADGPLEFLFVVDDAADAACGPLRQLFTERKGIDARIVVAPHATQTSQKIRKCASVQHCCQADSRRARGIDIACGACAMPSAGLPGMLLLRTACDGHATDASMLPTQY